jgi:hypothetical protein
MRPSLLAAVIIGFAGTLFAAEISPFAAIDAQLSRGEWAPALSASRDLIGPARRSLLAAPLAGVLARIAVAEAGLGLKEDAIWHWHEAQNLERSVLTKAELMAYGPPGELLARNPLRREDQSPPGIAALNLKDRHPGLHIPPRTVGDPLAIPREVETLPVPSGLKVQYVQDKEGRILQPVVLSGGIPGTVYDVLEELRRWRFIPASFGGKPVALLDTETLHAPNLRALRDMAALSGKAADLEKELRQEKWASAGKRARRIWTHKLGTGARRAEMATILALRALAQAGAGQEDEAICRWQAAQHLDPGFYDADLSAYGPAGALLDRHRWGTERVAAAGLGVGGPEVKKRVPLLPAEAVAGKTPPGVLTLAGIADEKGAVRQPLILGLSRIGEPVYDLAVPEISVLTWSGTLQKDDPRLLAIRALDAFCEWRFQPVVVEGKAGAYQEVMFVRVPGR